MSNTKSFGKVMIFFAAFIISIRGIDLLMQTNNLELNLILMAIGIVILAVGIFLYKRKED